MALDSAPRPPGKAATVKRNLFGDKDCRLPAAVSTESPRAPFPASFTLLSQMESPHSKAMLVLSLSFVQRPLQDGDDCSAGTLLSGSPPSSEAGTRGLSFTRRHTARSPSQPASRGRCSRRGKLPPRLLKAPGEMTRRN